MLSKVWLFDYSAVLLLLLLSLVGQTVALATVARDNSSDCFLRGFPGSTLNKCGYCVGGKTGLPPDFGLDCDGTCGQAFTDCAGTCNGESYEDECTLECTGGTTLTNDKSQQTRDCRGLCRLGELTSSDENGFDYVKDECDVCIARSRKDELYIQPTTTETPLSNTSTAVQTLQNWLPTINATKSPVIKREAPIKPITTTNTKITRPPSKTKTTINITSNSTPLSHTTTVTESENQTSPTTETPERTSQPIETTKHLRQTTDTTEHVFQTSKTPERTSQPITTTKHVLPTTDTPEPTSQTSETTKHLFQTTETARASSKETHPTNEASHNYSVIPQTTPTPGKVSHTTEIPEEKSINVTTNSTSNALNADSTKDNVTGKSAYMDCTGTCYTPATFVDMAIMSNETCHQCLGIDDWKSTLLRNECGRCFPDSEPCLCPKTQQDICGVCNGNNDTCTTIHSAYPTNIPSDTAITVNAVGVTLKSKYHAVCLLIRLDIQADGRDEWKFPADVSGTSISCSITAPEGLYRLHLGVTLENGDIMTYSNTSLPFLVYSKSASIRSMSPTMAVIPKPANDSNRLLVTFEAQELQRVDTLYATIYGGDGYGKTKEVMSTNVTENTVSFEVPFPVHSSTSNINISMDLGPRGQLNGPFSLTFYASAPSITHFMPLPEGDRMVIFFDTDVATGTTNATSTNCSRVFAAQSMATLGENSTCVWVTKRQLMVTFGFSKPPVIGPNALSIDRADVILLFNDKAIYADNENYTQPANNMTIAFKLADEPPLAILSGPSGVVPSCGDFILDGHQSAGLQTRRAHYVWSVAVGDSPTDSTTYMSVETNYTRSNITNDDDNLTRLLKEATTSNLAYVVVQSSDMKYNVDYTFSLTVSNGATSESPSSTDTLIIVRSRVPLPAVFIEPSVVQYRERVSIDSRFTLTVHLDMPMCLRELYSIHFRWSTPNPQVKFDVLQMNSTSYTVEPYTLPPNEEVTFEVNVWLNNNVTLSSQASITFETDAPVVKAILSGGKQRSVGIDSGLLQLNASASYHSTMPNLPLVYRWECLTEDGNPCYNYDPSLKETQLVASPIDRAGILSVPTNRLRVGDRMTFRMRAFSPTNSSEMSVAQTVVIQVTNDNAPLVTIEHIVSKNKLGSSKPEVGDDMLYEVTSDVNVEVLAIVHSSSSPIANIKWEITGFAWNLNPYSLREDVLTALQNWTVRASLVIRKDLLVANGLYEINVMATNEQGQSGWSTAEFFVTSPVSNCRVSVPEYEAFTMGYVYVDGCTTSHRSYPLRYQAFVYYKGSPMSITPSQFHLPMSIMGPPAMPSSIVRSSNDGCDVESYNDSMNTFAVEVCDVFENCWLFNSSRTLVRPARDMQEAATHAFAMANIAKLTDNYLTCVRRHAFYLMEASQNPTYLVDNELEFQSQLAQAYVCARKAAEDQCTDANCFASLFTFLTAIPIDTRTSREFMMTEVLDRALQKIDSLNLTLTAAGVQEVFIVLEAVYRFNVSDVTAAKAAVTMEDRFQRILARSLAIGESPVLTDTLGRPVVAMSYDGLNSPLEVLTNATANSTVSVHFGSEFNSKYDAWKCQEEDGPMCKGVVAELQFYPDHVFRPITVDDRPNRTVSDVIRATLLNPATGETVEDRSGTMMLTVPIDRLRMSEDLDYECHFWNVDDEKWSLTGMKTSDGGGKTLDCESDHLATIVVIGSEPTMSAWVIAVIVVSCLAVLILLAGGGFYFYRKSRTKTMRVSMSRGYHANGQ